MQRNNNKTHLPPPSLVTTTTTPDSSPAVVSSSSGNGIGTGIATGTATGGTGISTSTSATTNAEASTSQLLRGFLKKTVENSASTAQTLWKQRVQQQQQQHNSSSSQQSQQPYPQQAIRMMMMARAAATSGTTNVAAASASSATAPSTAPSTVPSTASKKQPLISVTQLEQASLSPASIDHHQDHEDLDEDGDEVYEKKDQLEQDNNHAKEEAPQPPPTYWNEDSSHSSTHSGSSASGEGSEDDEDEEDDEEEDDDIETDNDTFSNVETNSSVYSNSYYSSESATAGNKFSALQWAAASVVDSVQSGYFRGRYAQGVSTSLLSRGGTAATATRTTTLATIISNTGDGRVSSNSSTGSASATLSVNTGIGGGGATTTTPITTTPRASGGASSSSISQTTKILHNSAHAGHVREMLDKLSSPYEYIMFLGKGMLGVNLKQAYLQKIGVYVDYLIPHGAADRSNLIQVGDLLVQVGEIHVRNQTILNIPQQIAVSKRPLHLIWATGLLPGVENMNYVELAVAHLQRWREDQEHNNLEGHGASSTTKTATPSSPRRERESPQNHQQQKHHSTPDAVAEAAGQFISLADEKKSNTEPSMLEFDNDYDDHHPKQTQQPFLNSSNQQPHPLVQIPAIEHDSMDVFCNPGIPSLSAREAYHSLSPYRNSGFSVLQLCQNAATDEIFRTLLQYAFMLCAIDDRRFAFLSRHLSQQEKEEDENADKKNHFFGGKNNKKEAVSPSSSSRPFNAPSALLMLYVEMVTFADLYGVTPQPRIRQIANRIAYKFFLPTRLMHELVPPMFDFHQIVPDSILRTLEARLHDPDAVVPRDLFVDFCTAAMESLASHPFVTFLVSAECARMRAYLRNTAIFVNVPLHHVFHAITTDTSSKTPSDTTAGEEATTTIHAQNYFSFILLFLLCQTDKEGYGENNELLSTGNGARCQDWAGSVCAALFIRRQLTAAVHQVQSFAHVGESNNNGDQSHENARRDACNALILAWERLWEIFLAPHVGALALAPLSNEASAYLSAVVSHLDAIRLTIQMGDSDRNGAAQEKDGAVDSEWIVASKLCDDNLLKSARMLADELIYEYAATIHSKFREHKFHEWLCSEFASARESSEETKNAETITSDGVPRLPEGCVKRLLRRATIPVGVAPHKPVVQQSGESVEEMETETMHATCTEQVNAEWAVVFGTRVGLFDSDPALMINDYDETSNQDPLRRYACEPLYLSHDCASGLAPLRCDEIPPTLESFAVIPTATDCSPGPFRQYRDGQWISSDGWEVAVVNVRMPRGDSSEERHDSFIYGAALILRSASFAAAVVPHNGRTELVYEQGLDEAGTACPVTVTKDTNGSLVTKVRVGVETPVFNDRLADKSWTERIAMGSASQATVGLVLLSHRNVILSMRETLIKMFQAFCEGSICTCSALADVLGNFAHDDVETGSLHAILASFLKQAAAPWLERPIISQKHEFEQLAGRHLMQCLPPVPLALMFVTAILEQKIVIASSRRSLLLNVSVALSKMLRPLSWCHLLVPRVPFTLASDLLQYPAPFILGIPSEDPGMMDLIRELPDDVTLVDLDIGRVLLAQSFSHVEFGRGTPNNPKTARALRSQVLYLAQSLGGLFGSVYDPEIWFCDRPFSGVDSSLGVSQFDKVCAVCRDFVNELLAGTPACCYWIEEASLSTDAKQEPTVLFDEDRFFHIKSMRQRHGFKPLFDPFGKASRPSLALSLTDFELVLEVLMRCQSMNAFIASCDKDTMAYCLNHQG